METPIDLTDPAQREQALRQISPEHVKQHHVLLREIFSAEIEYRRRDEEWEYFENLYWCAWLLFLVGDPSDVEQMWVAKNLNMDTGTGFDEENMVGAGVGLTIEYLRRHNLNQIAERLGSRFKSECNEELVQWSADKRSYFYGD
jgi:hypothetical protein